MRPIDLARRFRDLPRWIVGGVLALFVAVGVLAFRPEARQALPAALRPTASAPPALSPEHKLQFQVIIQRLQIAKLKYEADQREFADAQRDAATLVEQTKVSGYDLDLQTFNYVPLAAPKK